MIAFEEQLGSRILLIEDDYGNRVLFADFLKYCGYHVLPLADGTNFLEEITTFQPDLILLDLKLPNMSGFTILETLKHHPRLHTIPIVIVSGYAFQADRRKAMNLGAADYLVKPIQPDALHQVVQVNLKSAAVRG